MPANPVGGLGDSPPPVQGGGPTGTGGATPIATGGTLPWWWALLPNENGVRVVPIDQARGVTLGDVQPDEMVPELLGRVRIRGTLVYLGPVPSQNPVLQAEAIVVWGEGEIDAVEQLYWNDVGIATITNPDGSSITVTHHRGDAVVVPDVFPGGTFDTSGWHGHAWTKIEIHGSTTTAGTIAWWQVVPGSGDPNTVPTVSADIRGRRVYDPRHSGDPIAWSQNNALLARHLAKVWGKLTDAELDDASVAAAAEVCDDRGFEFNYAFTTKTKLRDALATVLQACCGSVTRINGKWGIAMDAENAGDPVLTLDEGAGTLWDVKYRWLSKKDRPTRVIVKFKNAAAAYKDDQTPPLEDAGLATGKVPVRELVVDFPGVTTLAHAVVLRDYLYNSRAITFRIEATASFGGALLSKGNKVLIATLAGVLGAFQVEQVGKAQGGFFPVVLKPYDAAVYSSTPITQGTPVIPDWLSSLPNPFLTVNVPMTGNGDGPAVPVTSEAPEGGSSSMGLYFDQARHYKSAELFGVSFWSNTGATILGFDASKVNDGNVAVDFGTLTGPAGPANIQFDAGHGNTRRFGKLVLTGTTLQDIFDDSTLHQNVTVDYSDNGTSWSEAEPGDTAGFRFSNSSTVIVHEWADVGAHRYWRFRYREKAAAVTAHFRELQPLEIAGPDPFVLYYELYATTALNSGVMGKRFGAPIPAFARPYDSSHTVDVSGLRRFSKAAGGQLIVVVEGFVVARTLGGTGTPVYFGWSGPNPDKESATFVAHQDEATSAEQTGALAWPEITRGSIETDQAGWAAPFLLQTPGLSDVAIDAETAVSLDCAITFTPKRSVRALVIGVVDCLVIDRGTNSALFQLSKDGDPVDGAAVCSPQDHYGEWTVSQTWYLELPADTEVTLDLKGQVDIASGGTYQTVGANTSLAVIALGYF